MNTAARLSILVSLLGASALGAAPALAHPAPYMPRSIVLNMGDDARSVTNARSDALFRGGDAAQDVAQEIRAGRLLINGRAIPATADAFAKACPEGWAGLKPTN